MSRAAKWKVDKNKVKVVFRLQFHATHIPQTGWNNLFISFVPVETGKATAKTNKSSVRNGSCKWSDPIYETTRLLQDSKTKQFEEKIYKLIVAMGTSRSSLLGEASINLSDYVDALKPTVVALPLQGNDSSATLHVTVQLLTSKTGFREFEQQREVSDSGLQTNSDHNSGKVLTTGDVVSRLDKVNPRLKSKPDSKELPSLEKESGISGEYADSAGFDGSSNTSGSLSAEKHEISSCREIDSVKSTVSGEPGGLSPTQSPRNNKGATNHHFLQGGTSDWVHRWGAENSTDSEIAIVYEENRRLREALEAADGSIHDLRKKINSLQSCAEDIGVETQNLTKKVSIEIAADQELVKEISLLKSECARFKDDLEWLKTLKLNPQISKSVDPVQCNIIQDLSMRWIKGLQLMEEKIKEVQEKVHLGFNEKDSMLLQTDLETLFRILQDLKRGTEGCMYQFDNLSTGKAKESINVFNSSNIDHVIADTGLGVELCHPEGVLLPGLLATGASSVDPTNAMQGEIFKLLRELDESKSEKEGLLRKMNQMECYYEALIQELEENQKQILGELQSLRNEHSSCIYTVSSTKAQMEAMHQQMSNEILQLAEERCTLEALNKELERRGLASEAALKRARLNYSIAVKQLQKDLGVLSLQVHSMYETNENLIRKTFSEALEPVLQGSPDVIPTGLGEGSDMDKVEVSLSRNGGVKSQLLGSDILLEDLKRSLVTQEELIGKIQEEVSELLIVNVYLDIFSVSLRENLVEAASRSRFAEVEAWELAKLLEISSKENETLKVKWQNMTDHIADLSEEKGDLVSRCNDLALQNEKLEENLKRISDEKLTLDVKVGELGNLLSDYKSYKINYEICNAEKLELVNLLELATAEKGNLSKEVSLLQEELMNMKSELNGKEHLQNIVDYLREKLENLLVRGNEQVNDTLSGRTTEDMKHEFEHLKSIMLQLEMFHQKLHDKTSLLEKDKEDLLNEHDVAKLSLASARTEVEVVKQEFQHDLEGMVNKLDASTTLVENLQKNMEIVGEKLKRSTEVEEKYMQMTQDLLSDFAKMDASLEELNFKYKDLAEETRALGSVTEEIVGNKLTIDKLTQENLSLNDLLLNKTNESSMLTLELDNIKGNVGILQDEINLLKEIKHKLEADVLNLNAELQGRDEKLSYLDQQNAEIIQLKQLISDMELEKASLHHQLLNCEENLKKDIVGCTTVDLEIQLINMHELVIATNVTCTYIMKHYKDHVAELLQHLEYSNQQCLDVEKKNFDLTSTLNSCIARNEIIAEENRTLLSNLESLRSELESYVTLNRDLEHSISEKAAELEEYKNEKDLLKTSSDDAKAEHQCEIRELKSLLGNCQKENDDLMFQKEETEIRFFILKALVEEMSSNSGLHEECSEQMTMLKKQCSDLSCKLSEQVLKTEEFKNLTIHLKELKDKSVEKKQAEGSLGSMQESLRMAFIKEQYETKIQELKYQLSISKKHGEEMLWKLQDALDELETKKKCEASHLKRNEELQSKIVELEAELRSVLSENRERFMAYEQLKAELDCSVMSLDCCKEESKQLMASLQESNDENSRLTDEIELMREQIENMKSFMTSPAHNKVGSHIVQMGLNEPSNFGNSVDNSLLSRREALDEGISRNSSDDQANHLFHSMTLEIESDNEESMSFLAGQDALATKDTEDSTRGSQHDALLNDQMKAKTLLACIERLQKELDVMRNENTLLEDENENGLDSEGLQREQMHLQKVTKELGDMSSLYNDSSRSGNSVERVLALELELAEALQAKKSTIQFQSSFLKLHSDEGAVFQSFRDINELIKDMLEMKERYGAMEAELKEMHERYSQLSLNFAEVEGERQKLTMTLKNVRPSKRLLSWPQSSSHKDTTP